MPWDACNIQHTHNPVRGNKTHFANLYGASLLIPTQINTQRCTHGIICVHTNRTTHPPTAPFISWITVLPDVELSLIWTRGATAAPDMNTAVVHFTARITLMYWPQSWRHSSGCLWGALKATEQQARTEALSETDCKQRQAWSSNSLCFIMPFYHILIRRPFLLLCFHFPR